jgi:hypothetical protein
VDARTFCHPGHATSPRTSKPKIQQLGPRTRDAAILTLTSVRRRERSVADAQHRPTTPETGAHVRTHLEQVSIGPTYPVHSLTPSRSCGYDLDGHRARPRLLSNLNLTTP